MQRKWTVLTGSMLAGLALFLGFSAAVADEDSPLHKLMEQVNLKKTVVYKATRNDPSYKKARGDEKSRKDLVSAAEDLAKLGKEAKPIKDAAKKAKEVKDAEARWDTLMDDFVKQAEDLAKVLSNEKTTQVQAKGAYTNMNKACSACHDVFRVEE